MKRTIVFGLAAIVLGTGGAGVAPAQQRNSRLSVLTYNVEGLPWPIRLGRSQNLAQIAAGLRQMRHNHSQPDVIVFQEAFSPAAKMIARDAGYRYIADGPGRDLTGAAPLRASDRAFAAAGNIFVGEGVGKWTDSGLRIASDYPILAARRMAYPSFACAGFDCLANKGILLVELQVPGVGSPVAVVATHLNSRSAAHVDFTRSLYAYRRQIDALSDFLRRNVPATHPVIIAGDFNAGRRADRRLYLLSQAARWRPGLSLRTVLAARNGTLAGCRIEDRPDLDRSARRARDWQFFGSGYAATLRMTSLSAPFGHQADGTMLSDHIGYVATFDVADRIDHRSITLASR